MEHKLKIGFKGVRENLLFEEDLKWILRVSHKETGLKLVLRPTPRAKHLKSISRLRKLEECGNGKLKSISSHLRGFPWNVLKLISSDQVSESQIAGRMT